jgi:predicted SAM-dependent methyltransferase
MSLKDFLKRKIIRPSMQFKANIEYSALTSKSPPSYYCPVCSSGIHDFNRLSDSYIKQLDNNGFMFSLFQFETLNYLQYLCPVCGSSDRDRLYALYLEENPPQKPEYSRGRLLDFAPAKRLQKFICERLSDFEYRSADLTRHDVDDLVDITHMEIYSDQSFDFFICSHILEHVNQDKSAIRELFRILKPGGEGIAMVPIMLTLDEDYDNINVVTSEQRWKHFGQDDHVRLYSKSGFRKKLSEAGFQVNEFDAKYFGIDKFKIYGIHQRSVLYVVKKPPLILYGSL